MLARDKSPLKRTPLHALHVARGGKLVPFAGYEMPVQFPAGVLKEHLHTRSAAGLFDVSHMGQLALRPKSGQVADAALALERLVPQDIVAVPPGRQRYAQFTNNDGGILDDLMVANFGDHLFLVVNAACKAEDEAHLRAHLSEACAIDSLADRALIALQGPKAESVLAKFCADVTAMRFMDSGPRKVAGFDAFVSRSGPEAARRCAKARRCLRMPLPPSRSARSLPAASARASMPPSRWVICRHRWQHRARESLPNCAGSDCRCWSRPCPSFPTPI